MRNFTLGLISLLSTIAASAQTCPTTNGMIATGFSPDGNCFMFVQNAIPNSTVYLFSNTTGLIAQGPANAQGNATITYNCASGPVNNILSRLPSGEYCDKFLITQQAVLPVKWSSFTTRVVTGGVQLNWSTSYEFNNEKYFVEKSSDGVNYKVVGELESGGDALETTRYQYTDGSYSVGTVAYYRIRQVDIDRSATYSKVVYVNTSKSSGPVKIFPNPFVNEIQLTGLNSAEITKGNVKVFTIAGTQVNYEISGSNAIRINDAPAGVYILSVNGNSYKLLKN
ncbi:MAG: T9SS type A sorting domain-containing protein [Chitinophagaceae bacterium]|nr:MAG: T9SS type A sorting domain-containing protein [Chitinophagaceae bacterium]